MAHAVNVPQGIGDVADVLPARTRLLGFSARESAVVSGPATFILRDGTDATGVPVAFVNLAASAVSNVDYGAIGGIELRAGLFLDRVTGTTDLTVYA